MTHIERTIRIVTGDKDPQIISVVPKFVTDPLGRRLCSLTISLSRGNDDLRLALPLDKETAGILGQAILEVTEQPK